METNNANVNKELINNLLEDNQEEKAITPEELDAMQKDLEAMNGMVAINLCTCRFAFPQNLIDWDSFDLDELKKLRATFIAARFNLIKEPDVEKRAEIADSILKDVHEIEGNLGLEIDYYNIRPDITKIECAILAIVDVITIYEWHINAIINKQLLDKDSLDLQDNNIEFLNQMSSDPAEDIKNQDEKEPDYILDPSLVSQLAASFEDDHNVSGLITE
jgi:hypothetical protein